MSSTPTTKTSKGKAKGKACSLADTPVALRSSLDADVMPQLARMTEHYR